LILRKIAVPPKEFDANFEEKVLMSCAVPVQKASRQL